MEDGFVFKTGQSVGLFDDSFPWIVSIVKDDGHDEIFLCGRRLFKMASEGMDTCTSQWSNEVVWVVAGFCAADVPLALVKRVYAIRFTNWSFHRCPVLGEYLCRLKRIRACVHAHERCVCERGKSCNRFFFFFFF